MASCVLGTMNIHYPYSSNSEDSINIYKEIIETYLKAQSSSTTAILDTAYYYGNTKCEQTLGLILPELSYLPKIATKVNPWFENDFTNGKLGQLDNEGINRQLSQSLAHLNIPKIDILYLHCPDYETSIKETLLTCNTLWRKEKFNHLGISNYSKNQLKEILEICELESFVKPTYYQGMYNLISRKIEELFPLLTENNIEFWAYNPLAGGLLTGKYNNNSYIQNNSCRFKNNTIYKNIFWKPEIIDHLRVNYFMWGQDCCTDYSLQWLKYNSFLKPTDKIVLGVSNNHQLLKNISILNEKVLLSNIVIDYLDRLYKPISKFSPNYFY